MKKLLLFLFVYIPQIIFAQNLVPNPSFEDYTVCPNSYFMLPTDWYSCSATPDYFNACDSTNSFGIPINCFGYQQAADGRAYCGFYAFGFTEPPPNCYKEYLGCQLINSLQIGQKYFISFKVIFSGGFGVGIATNNIGLLFSTISFQVFAPYDPTKFCIPTNNFAHIKDTSIITDSQNWTIIKGSIIADSAYQYILIGDFYNAQNTDTTIINSNYLKASYYYLDEVCVSTDSLLCNLPVAINKKNYEIKIFPNPASDYLSLKFTQKTSDAKVVIYNLLGELISTSMILSEESKINISRLPTGVYILEALTEKNIMRQKFIKRY